MDFEGAQYDESFILADVQLESDLARDRVHLFLGDDGVVGRHSFLRKIVGESWPTSRRIRATNRSREVTLDEVQALLERRGRAGAARERSDLDGALSTFRIARCGSFVGCAFSSRATPRTFTARQADRG